MLSRGELDAKAVAMLARVDLWYVGAAAAALATGLCRAFAGAKGWAFYSGDWVFWAKVASFAAVGGLSIPPTLAFRRWRLRAASDVSGKVARRLGALGPPAMAFRAGAGVPRRSRPSSFPRTSESACGATSWGSCTSSRSSRCWR